MLEKQNPQPSPSRIWGTIVMMLALTPGLVAAQDPVEEIGGPAPSALSDEEERGGESAWLHIIAEEGNASAQYHLGVLYAQGQRVGQDYAESAKWFHRAAEQGNASAQFELGILYAKGRGVVQDYAEAVKWYRRAAKGGNAGAQHNLGDLYARGEGVVKDDHEAVKWFRKAAEQGAARAQHNLGLMYGTGRGVPQDYVQAHKWLNLAAAQGEFDEAAQARDIVAAKMTKEQVFEAQKLAREWEPNQEE